ncbi:MAG: hypothetical protein RLZZ08_1685 [Pseudomonadota bacterium]|jgi:colanic acid biosynthesis glycosyl transferase WcaI
MKILFIGLNYAPEPVGIGPYTSGLAEALVQAGHQVEVVAGKPYYPQWQPYPGQPAGVTSSVENGVTITRVPHYIPANPSGARRIAHHLSFALAALRPALQAAARKPDLVFTVAPSLMSVPVAKWAARRAGAPLWLHVQDFEVEAAFATGLIGGGSLAARAARGVENRILAMADVASSISPQMCAKLADKGVAAGRIVQLRNWNNARIDPATANPASYRAQWQLGARKVALYSGNIANKQGLEVVVQAARILHERDDIAFIICGEGPNRARLQDLATGIGNIQFHDLQPADRMADFLTLADVHLLPQIVGAADLVLPSKLTNMLASARPVVATAAPGTGLFDEVEGCGINTPPGDAQALADAIVRLVDDPALAARLGAEARRRADERWSLAATVATFESRLRAL